MSRNQAAQRFGVAISTAINWARREDEIGSVEPGQMGGHKPKAISGEHAVWLRQRIRGSDFTLRGLVAELAERGPEVDYRSVWEFVHAETPACTERHQSARSCPQSRSTRFRARRAIPKTPRPASPASVLAFGLVRAALAETDDRAIRVLQGRAMGRLSEIRVRLGYVGGRAIGCLVAVLYHPRQVRPARRLDRDTATSATREIESSP
jgi:putative transposase